MKLGVISDTHGDLLGWQKIISEYFNDSDVIIHAGDILYHGPRNPMPKGYNPAKLALAINNSKIPVLIAHGNCDSEVDQLAIEVPIQSSYLFLQYQNRRILATHGDMLTQDQMVEQGKRYKVNVFIFGHIHLPVLEKRNEVILLNPGSPSLSKFKIIGKNRRSSQSAKNQRSFADGKTIYTAALIMDEEIRIFDIDTGRIVNQLTF